MAARRRRRSILDRLWDDLADALDDLYEQQQQARGSSESSNNHHSRHGPLTPEENQLYIEIVELGFREAVKKYHPDRGGDPDKMACINALRDKVHRIAGIRKAR